MGISFIEPFWPIDGAGPMSDKKRVKNAEGISITNWFPRQLNHLPARLFYHALGGGCISHRGRPQPGINIGLPFCDQAEFQ